MGVEGGGMPLIDIIIPVHNEEKVISIFYERLCQCLGGIVGVQFRICFSNNGSSDSSLEVIRKLARVDDRIEVLSLSRNFGYQISLMASLSQARGDASVIIDVDGEDPPEMIPQFIDQWLAGNDLVYGERSARPESPIIVMARKLFYRITHQIADSDFIVDMAEFSLFSREVREVILKNKSTHPFVRNEIAFAGFSRKAIPYARQERIAGKTHYNFSRMAQFALAGILTSSTFPLRAMAYVGVPFGLIFLVIAGVRLIDGAWLAVFDALYNMFLIYSMVVVGLYLARIYKDGIGRPLYVVDWKSSLIKYPRGCDESGNTSRWPRDQNI